MTEKGIDILKNKIRQLPEYAPDGTLWQSIDAWLRFDEKLFVEVRQLPEYIPDEKTWGKIEKAIPQTPVRRIHLRYFYYAAGIILLITGISLYLHAGKSRNIQVATEILFKGNQPEKFNEKWPEPTTYINSLCRLNASICNSADFLEKKKMLDELESNEKEILRYEASFGSSDALERSKVRIEKMRAGIIKELLEMIEG
jgi:hypothetical protein